jgi:hypothetical protein
MAVPRFVSFTSVRVTLVTLSMSNQEQEFIHIDEHEHQE